MNHNCNFFFLHELSWCASSDVLIQWRIFHMNHNCNFFLHLRVSWCAYSDVLIEWRFLYKYHTYNVYVLHELSGCASSDFLIQWRIFHKNRICNSFVLHELSWCAYSDFRLVSIWIVNSWVWPKILLHILHSKILTFPWTILMCLSLDWLVENFFSQFPHLNFLDESISTFKRWLWKLFRGALLFSWCYFPKPFIYNLTRNVIDFGK